MDIIVVCIACFLCGIMVIGCQYMLDKANAKSAGEWGFYGVGVFFILISSWGIYKEYKIRELIKQGSYNKNLPRYKQ